jgi:hypothetical protein
MWSGVVVELGVGEDGDIRLQLQQRAVGLVGLDDDPLTGPPRGVRAGRSELPPDHIRGIEPATAQRVHDHPGRRGLAVGSGDRQAAAQRRDLREQVGSVKLASRCQALGILRPHGRRVHDLGARGDVPGAVTDERLDPVLAQPLGVRGLGAIRSRDLRTERFGDEGQATHPGAADADEVQPSRGPVLAAQVRSSTTTGISRSVFCW